MMKEVARKVARSKAELAVEVPMNGLVAWTGDVGVAEGVVP